MNFKNLNKMIDYIENNLTEKIEYKELAKIIGISEYSLQRIFIFLTDISISEYIRKRRLSKAFEELKNTNNKIIDVAIKYGYDSQISFSRAFKTMFKIKPSEVKNSTTYELFPVILFKNNNELCNQYKYEIKNIDSKVLYGKSVSANNHDDFLYKIRDLYSNIKKNGMHEKFNKKGMYGISFEKNNKFYYFVGSEEKNKLFEKFIIPNGKYAIFSVGSREQKDIVKLEKKYIING